MNQDTRMGDSAVMLSAAKHLATLRDRPCAALRVTPGGNSTSDNAVMLSAAKHLATLRDRPCATLRVTGLGPIMAFNKITWTSVGADLSRPPPIYRPSLDTSIPG